MGIEPERYETRDITFFGENDVYALEYLRIDNYAPECHLVTGPNIHPCLSLQIIVSKA